MPRRRARRQVGEHRPDGVVGVVQVRPDEVVEPVAPLFAVAVGPTDSARRDERMARPERICRAGDRLLDGGAIPDVTRNDERLALDGRRGRLERLTSTCQQAHRGTIRCEPLCDRAANARTRARDHDVSLGHPSPIPRNLRAFPRRLLASPRRQRLNCRCAEHGTRLGRSSPEGPDAEANGQSGKWTKAHPARRTPGPILCRAPRRLRKLACSLLKRSQRAGKSDPSTLT